MRYDCDDTLTLEVRPAEGPHATVEFPEGDSLHLVEVDPPLWMRVDAEGRGELVEPAEA